MEQIMNYVKPELIVVAIVLYFCGMALKQTQMVKDKYIPMLLGAGGIVLCGIWVLATSPLGNGQEIAMAVFTAIVQGILMAGLSNYVNQIIKQANKKGETITGTCKYDVDSSDATAAVAEILQGKTAYVRGKKLIGTMKNNSAVAGTISSKDEQYTVPQGYHDGSGKVGIVDTEKEKLVPANIREGITLLGVEGTMSGTEDAKPQAKTVTPKTTEQTVLPDTEEGYNYLSQVTVAAIPYQESENPAGGTTVTIG